MKTLLSSLLIIATVIATSACGSKSKSADDDSIGGSPAEGPSFKANELMIKDYDEMLAMVQSLVAKAKDLAGPDGTANEDEAIFQLRQGLKLIFSRPNSDNMIAKLVPEVRRELIGFNAFESSIAKVVDGAIYAVKNDAPVSVQSTSLYVLENVLSEIHPEIENNTNMHAIVETIASANVKISKDVIKERRLRGMFLPKMSPSDIAKGILKREKAAKKK